MPKVLYSILIAFFVSLGLGLSTSCSARKEYPGTEYAPQMYHSVPYEGLSQIKDKESGRWLTSRSEGPAEFYNSNPYNPSGMTMRLPVEGTVARRNTQYGPILPYLIPKDSLTYAGKVLRNPVDSTASVLAEAKMLYRRFCWHCHGETGGGDGPVGKVYKGVTPYNSRAVKNVPEGHIFHVITHGKGRMKSHASQISPIDRWKIVRYVQVLQKQ